MATPTNYRKADSPDRSCAKCGHFRNGICKRYTAYVESSYVCRSWKQSMNKTADHVATLLNAFRKRPKQPVQQQPQQQPPQTAQKGQNALGDGIGEYFKFGSADVDKSVKAAGLVKRAQISRLLAPALGVGIPAALILGAFRKRQPLMPEPMPMPVAPPKRQWMQYANLYGPADNSPLWPYIRKHKQLDNPSEYYA